MFTYLLNTEQYERTNKVRHEMLSLKRLLTDSIRDDLHCQLTRNPTRLRSNLKLTAAYVSKYQRVTRTSLNTMPNTFQLLEIATYLLIHIDLYSRSVCRKT